MISSLQAKTGKSSNNSHIGTRPDSQAFSKYLDACREHAGVVYMRKCQYLPEVMLCTATAAVLLNKQQSILSSDLQIESVGLQRNISSSSLITPTAASDDSTSHIPVINRRIYVITIVMRLFSAQPMVIHICHPFPHTQKNLSLIEQQANSHAQRLAAYKFTYL